MLVKQEAELEGPDHTYLTQEGEEGLYGHTFRRCSYN